MLFHFDFIHYMMMWIPFVTRQHTSGSSSPPRGFIKKGYDKSLCCQILIFKHIHNCTTYSYLSEWSNLYEFPFRISTVLILRVYSYTILYKPLQSNLSWVSILRSFYEYILWVHFMLSFYVYINLWIHFMNTIVSWVHVIT